MTALTPVYTIGWQIVEQLRAHTDLSRAAARARAIELLVAVGLPNPAAQWPLQAVSLIAEERTIKGSYVGSCVPSRDIPRLIAMYRAGRLPVRALLSETISLEQINPALDRLARGEAVRQVILPHGG